MILLAKYIKLLTHSVIERKGLLIIILFLVSYLSGYALMIKGEESDIINNYFWWYIVTATTVGYGDLYPVTFYGRVAAVIVMFIGIGIIALFIGNLIEMVIHLATRKRKGIGKMNYVNHTLIIGYRKGNTERVIDEILTKNPNEKIVLCSESLTENPIKSNKAQFIFGETASNDVMTRAAAAHANKIIIHGHNDNQTFFTAYAFREINQSAHLVCYLTNEDHVDKIHDLKSDEGSLNQVILPVNVYLMAQELQDPESSTVFQHFISNMHGATLYRVDIPKDIGGEFLFETVFIKMKKDFQATVVAIKDQTIKSNPNLNYKFSAGTSIFYLAEHRIDSIPWQQYQ